MDAMSSAYWLKLKNRLDEAYYLHPSESAKSVLWAIVSIMPIAIFLHLVTAYKRARLGGFWLVRFDTEGYFQENRNVLIPILSAIKTAIAFTCVISLQHDIRTHFHTTTIILQVSAFVAMHSLNWLRTWASIYSMPPPSLYNFNQKRTKSPFQTKDRMFHPWIFNSCVAAGLLYGVLLAVIGLITMCNSINRVNYLYHTLSNTLDENIFLSENPTSESLRSLKFNAAILREGMHDIQNESSHLFWLIDIVILCFLVINFLSTVLFWWSLHTIIRCLNTQLEAYSRSLRNRSEAIQLGMVSEHETTLAASVRNQSRSREVMTDLDSLEDQNHECHSSNGSESIHGNWRMWLPTFQRNTVVADRFLWKSPLMGQVSQKGPNQKASLRRQYILLRRFKTNTLWQAIFITLMTINYEAMGITLKMNPYDVPTRTSTAEVAVIIILWSNLIWTVGGTAMGALSAIVAYSGASTIEKKDVVEEQPDDAKSFDY